MALVGVVLGSNRFVGLTVAIATALCVALGVLALGHIGVVALRTTRRATPEPEPAR